MAKGDHGWTGGGRFRVARTGGVFILRFGHLTTQSGRLQDQIGDFFRKDYRRWRADYRPYAVSIWIETADTPRRLDVDNVAKATLDALTGVVWKDDSQVWELHVQKFPGEDTAAYTPGTITLAARALEDPPSHPPQDLAALLASAERLE